MDFSSEPVIRVKDACIFQGFNAILQNVNFSIAKDEFVFLIGRTGSGKSSLLKTLYADLDLKMGEAEIVGFNLQKIKKNEVPYLRRKLGIVFQDFQLFPDRSIAENIFFVMKATGWKDKMKMKSRMAEVLMQVNLGDSATKMPHQLSGGEQQRVVIARALINQPSILLADEPTGNLDPEVADGVFKLFQEINSQGTAILMATHNHDLLRKYPYRVLKCEKGQLLDSKTSDITINTSF
ncbi:phosphonate ABC transporter ATP-binding protein [Rhodonellum psychrophilum GCM71 = DSM 17998]|uniref:Cell division ATP-binding protein FtsE n=2 Tax=Rhodonellum TaxID=336827 RepID=U5C2Z8_9BACT|nr:MULTISPECIES: ATP-binding cassette domain-containing protein [Rhodonellum]ERM84189.1 phosphonate ABC transporter ATP-binding protein [Rhodonellum psychrophilum GCM71 = DSM 17998]MDO9554147.1 ATP-binding cassette domain-containing protein [Rhodonellum sp.]SDZ19303.1 cell division transport system ATP-binding protein [Rhodonellum ikkaensis]